MRPPKSSIPRRARTESLLVAAVACAVALAAAIGPLGPLEHARRAGEATQPRVAPAGEVAVSRLEAPRVVRPAP